MHGYVHTHTHTHIYIYIWSFVKDFMELLILLIDLLKVIINYKIPYPTNKKWTINQPRTSPIVKFI